MELMQEKNHALNELWMMHEAFVWIRIKNYNLLWKLDNSRKWYESSDHAPKW